MLTLFTLLIYIYVLLLSTAAELDRTVTREAKAGASGPGTRPSSSMHVAHQGPGHRDALVHYSNTFEVSGPVHAAVLTTAASIGVTASDCPSFEPTPPGGGESDNREEDSPGHQNEDPRTLSGGRS